LGAFVCINEFALNVYVYIDLIYIHISIGTIYARYSKGYVRFLFCVRFFKINMYKVSKDLFNIAIIQYT